MGKDSNKNQKARTQKSYDYSGAGYWIAQNSKVLFAYVGFQSLLLIVYEAAFNRPMQMERLMILGVPLLVMLSMRGLARDSAKPGLIAMYHSWTTILLASTGVAIGYLYKSDFHLSVLLLGIGSLIIMAGLSCYFWSWYLVNLAWLSALMVWTISPWFQISENRPVLFQTTAVIFISAVFCRTRVNEFKNQINQSHLWSDHQRELQAALNGAEESKNRFQKIYEGSFEGIVLHKAGYIDDCNGSLLEIFQLRKEEVIGQSIMKLLQQEGNTELMNSILIGENQSREIRTVNKFGQPLYLEVMSKLLHSDDVDIVATALRNITERKLAEEEVHAKNQALEHQFRRQKALAEWSAFMDRDQDIQELSGMILRYLSELLPAQAGVYFGLRSSRNSSWRVFVARNGRIEPETWASDKNRPLRQLADKVCTEKVTISCPPQELGIQKRAFAALPLDLSAGREGFIMVQDMNVDHYTDQDIDFLTTVATRLALGLENKKMVEDLVVAKDAAEAASKAKSQFLATLSHELRTPLNGIIGASQILEPVLDTSDDQSTLQVIRNSSETMINMVDRILSFTQVEGGKLKFQCAEFSLDTLMSDVLDSLESLRSSRNLHLNVHRGTDISQSWNSDYQSVKSIVLNLAENGLKFTNEGGVDIHLRTINRQGRRFLHIEVHDSGCGFPSDREEELFQPFTQAEGSHSRKFGGLGLGLAVCKALTHSLGGKIGTRPMNKGTIFWVEIPDGIHAAVPLAGDTEFFVSRSLDHDPDEQSRDAHRDAASPVTTTGAGKLSHGESTSNGKPNPARNESRTEGEIQAPAVPVPSASRRTLVVEVSPVLRMGLMRHFDKSDVEADFCKDLDEMVDRLRESIEQSVNYREVLISEKIQTDDLMKAMAGLQNEIGHGKDLPVFKRMIRSRGSDGRSGSGLKLEKIEPRKVA